MRLSRSIALLHATLLVAPWLSPARAEAGDAAPPLPGRAAAPISGSVGLAPAPGGFLGGGAGYEARFDAHGATFVPALGAAAPFEQTLALGAASLARGGSVVALAPAAPRADGLAVVYDRAPGVEERFEVAREGLWHSVVLAARPAGEGDLVVRIGVGGALAPSGARADSGGLVYDAGFGGVRYGALVGVDADGRTAPGTVRAAGDALELVLPAAFVDGARYPLVLDPLVGTELGVDASTWDDAEPDAAFDASTNRYLVVWKRTFSATSSAIRGQRVVVTGALDGGTLFFASSGAVSRPQVADANHASRFAVAWSQSLAAGDDVRVQACDPTTGALSQAVVVASGASGTLSSPDIGGEVLKNPYKQVLVVWDRLGAGIEGAKLELDVTGDPQLVTTFGVAAEVALFSQVDAPSISRTAGHSGLYAVAYLRRAPLIGGVRQVRVALVDRNGGLYQAGVDVTSSTTDEFAPDIDGGGFADARWVVVNAVDQAAAAHALVATPLVLLPGGLSAGPSETLSTDCEGERAAVAWHPGKAYVAWEQNGFFFDNLVLRGLDPTTCGTCETQSGVALLPAGTASVGLVMASSGGNYDYGRGLLVWNEESPDAASAEQDVVAQLFDAFADTAAVQDLGGACGAGGVSTAPLLPAIGNGFFQVLLAGASPAAPVAILNVAPPQAAFGCGPCAWVPFATTSVLPVVAGAAGRILPVPCDPTLVGGQVDVQWTVVTPLDAPCPAFPGVSVSNRLRLTVGS